jgi:SpoVK/Ycf46/Vps4 family AAA+-type ATPase
MGAVVEFPDYSETEKFSIFELFCQRASFELTPEAAAGVRDVIARCGHRADEGNARFVRKLYENVVGAQQIRLATNVPAEGYNLQNMREITEADVQSACSSLGEDTSDTFGTQNARDELDALIGLTDVKDLVRGRVDFMRIQKIKREAGLKTRQVPMHMAFLGNPGTGKTEVARLFGRILKQEGVLSVGDFYECSGGDFISGFKGGTPDLVKYRFEQARGSVLFIDEAYSLLPQISAGAEEAVAAIIQEMENLRDDVVVIFAGYTDEVNKLLSVNPGFESRVNMRIEFPDYNARELAKILQLMADNSGLTLAAGALEAASAQIETATRASNFGNARFVRNLLDAAQLEQSKRLAARLAGGAELTVGELTELQAADFEGAKVDAAASKAAATRQVGFC